jgi:hypothetical protein
MLLDIIQAAAGVSVPCDCVGDSCNVTIWGGGNESDGLVLTAEGSRTLFLRLGLDCSVRVLEGLGKISRKGNDGWRIRA